MSNKSRNLTIYNYLSQLQIEFMVAELRKKIATRAKDKSYYDRVLSHKKTKIEDICTRNALPSIFTDTKEYTEIRNQVYNVWGLPTFAYKNDQEKADIQKRDIYNYLSERSEIRILTEDNKTILGTIISSKRYLDTIISFDNLEHLAIEVHVKGESSPRPILVKHLARIL